MLFTWLLFVADGCDSPKETQQADQMHASTGPKNITGKIHVTTKNDRVAIQYSVQLAAVPASLITSYPQLIAHFSEALTTAAGRQALETFTRQIAILADANSLHHDGFYWYIKKNAAGVMQVYMGGKPGKEPGYLDLSYEVGNGPVSFGEHIERALAKDKNAQMAVFRSPFQKGMSPGRMLAIPTGKYPTVYHFSKHASAEEIIAFWQGVVAHTCRFGTEKIAFLSIHTGPNYRQSVAHFHFRIRIKAAYHADLKEQYYANLPDTM